MEKIELAQSNNEVMLAKEFAERLVAAIQPPTQLLSVQEVIQKATIAIIEVIHEANYANLTDGQSEILSEIRQEVEDPKWIQSS